MPHNLPLPISEAALQERVIKNLTYLRKEVFYKEDFSTLEIAKLTNLDSNKVKRVEDDLKGTIDTFLRLLRFYGIAGIELNSLFTQDLWTLEPGKIRSESVRRQEGDLTPGPTDSAGNYQPPCLASSTPDLFYKNIFYLRMGFLRGTGVTTKKMEVSSGVGREKILRIEKGGQGKIISVVSVIYYYIRKGMQLNTMLAMDLSAELN